jgi:hypothetical protein
MTQCRQQLPALRQHSMGLFICSWVSVVNMPAHSALVQVSVMCAHRPGGGRCSDCWRLPAADQKGYYEIFAVNPCRSPQVVEVVDIQPVPGSCVQQSNAQTGELRFLHGGAWAVSARERCQPPRGSSLPPAGSGPVAQTGAACQGVGPPRRGSSLLSCDRPKHGRMVLQQCSMLCCDVFSGRPSIRCVKDRTEAWQAHARGGPMCAPLNCTSQQPPSCPWKCIPARPVACRKRAGDCVRRELDR